VISTRSENFGGSKNLNLAAIESLHHDHHQSRQTAQVSRLKEEHVHEIVAQASTMLSKELNAY
jgi:hypothetical protein